MQIYKSYGSPEKDSFMLHVWQRPDLRPADKQVAGVIVRAYSGEPTPISLTEFASELGVTTVCVTLALKRLCKLGLVHKVRAAAGQGAKNHWTPNYRLPRQCEAA